DIEEDAARVKQVREAVGDRVKIMIDGNSKYDFVHARKLCKRMEPYDVTFFDSPVHVGDLHLMADLRRETTVPIANRSREGNIWGNRELIANRAVDVMQANVLDGGGYTECLKVAHMAEMYNLPLATGGSWHLQNCHLIAGVRNGWM